MSKRQYSDNDKASALAALDANEGNVNLTSKQIGVPRKTLGEWAQNRHVSHDMAELRHDKKEGLATIIEMAVREMIGASATKLNGANFQQLWTGVGIGVDKIQLLKGEPTAITGTALSEEDRAAKLTEMMGRGRARLNLLKPTGTNGNGNGNHHL